MIGLVLAGGQSRRFGVDKATYALPGHPANVVSAVKRLLPLCEQVIVVANPANQRQIQALVGDRVTVILDPEPFLGEGPVAGILAASQSGAKELLLSPCDYPNLTTQSMRVLAGQPMRYLQVAGKNHYTLAHFQTDQETVQAWLSGGQRRLQDFLKGALHCQPLVINADPKEFTNYNQRSSV